MDDFCAVTIKHINIENGDKIKKKEMKTPKNISKDPPADLEPIVKVEGSKKPKPILKKSATTRIVYNNPRIGV